MRSELIFQRGSLQYFPVLLQQLTAQETMETLTDMILSDVRVASLIINLGRE